MTGRMLAQVIFSTWAALALVGCSPTQATHSTGSTGTHGTSGTSDAGHADAGHADGGHGPADAGVIADFPAAPMVDANLPATLPDLFAAAPAGTGPGPCLSEPALEAMVPRNWTPLRFEWKPAGDQNVFELRLHTDNQTHDLVIYTGPR